MAQLNLKKTDSINTPSVGMQALGISTSNNLFMVDDTGTIIPIITNSTLATKEFIATGIIGASTVVGLKNDGTVEIVQGSYTPSSIGTAQIFSSTGAYSTSCAYDSTNNKIIIVYIDPGNNFSGAAIVGDIVGNVITFGTAQECTGPFINSISSAYDSVNNKIIITYVDSSQNGIVIVGDIVGTAITFGTGAVVAGNTDYISSACDSTNNKIIITYVDSANSYFGTVRVGDIVGTVITFPAPAQVFESGFTQYPSPAYDSVNNKIIVTYVDEINQGTVIVGDIVVNVITFGTKQAFTGGSANSISSAYDSTNSKIIITYTDGSNSNFGTVIVGNIVGTVVTFGAAQVCIGSTTQYTSSAYDYVNNKIIITYSDSANAGFGTVIVGDIVGTAVTFPAPAQVFASEGVSYISSAYDSVNSRTIISYRNDSDGVGTVNLYYPAQIATNVSSTIGINTTSKLNGEPATIKLLGGVSGGHSSLVVGAVYYADYNGVISTTTDAITGYKRLGIAVSATEILLDFQLDN